MTKERKREKMLEVYQISTPTRKGFYVYILDADGLPPEYHQRKQELSHRVLLSIKNKDFEDELDAFKAMYKTLEIEFPEKPLMHECKVKITDFDSEGFPIFEVV